MGSSVKVVTKERMIFVMIRALKVIIHVPGPQKFKFRRFKGSIGYAFNVRIRTGNQNQTSFYHFVLHEIFVLVKLILGHLRYLLTDVSPQPNSPPDNVFRLNRRIGPTLGPKEGDAPRLRFTE
ncbi:hypothetical protein VitviT2T_002916 [Vitis vinifera]|uniref:Regulator of rDNA transcription protein 15 n=1 Tax=Vitis vinifera TaxID=29760 RepID=A0ABY9BK65_VITVI|nr:hypothetical protein VitviT2T_002916 [Vitis vinifera]